MGDSVESDFRGWVASQRVDLRATAYMLSSDWHLADDLVQDALTRLYAVWERVTASGDPGAYARRILVNLYLDHQRRPWRRREVLLDALPDRAAYEVPSGADGLRDEVVAALRQVPPGQRAVLVLRFWDDLSVEQTASVLNTSVGNVKSQSSRGLDTLRTALLARGLTDLHASLGKEPT